MAMKVTLFIQMQYSIEKIEYENITEIHYRYGPGHESVAFESDIDGTGYTWPVNRVVEFEATQQEEATR